MRTPTTDQQAFETFYKDVRGRLLLQTWALTGDLSAAQKAVRDALVVAWHHWGKVRRLPEAEREHWVRPVAWQRAQRRHSVPHFHRDRGIDPEVRETLAALGKLPITQRKVLLLSCLAPVSLEQLSREVGIPMARTERELQTATAQFSLVRNVPTTSILALFEPMAAYVEDQRWPRPTILTRAGSARRRTHTVAGALLVVACVAGGGAFVSQGGSHHPTLEALSLHAPDTPAARPTGPEAYPLVPDDLLATDAVDRSVPGHWTTQLTSDSGSTSLPCAPRAVADRHPEAALVRTFAGSSAHDLVGQSVEAASTPADALAAYDTTLSWYAGCELPRMQLVDTRRVDGVGDEATVLALRDWSAAGRTLVVGVARTGVLTTAVTASVPGSTSDALRRVPKLLGDALSGLCQLPGAGACVTTPHTSEAAPLPVGKHPEMLDTLDLPPVAGVKHPWAGTAPQPAHSNQAASHCDNTDFDVKGVQGDLTRTFLVPDDKQLPAVFGLSETVGRLTSAKAASGFVGGIEHRLEVCGDKELGSKATRLSAPSMPGPVAISVWHVSVGRGHATTTYQMALVRNGSAVAQLSFIPAGTAPMDPADFRALALRAAARLAEL